MFVDWFHPGHPENPVLILLEIVPWTNGVIMFIFFICKTSNRELVARMLSAKSAPMPLAIQLQAQVQVPVR